MQEFGEGILVGVGFFSICSFVLAFDLLVGGVSYARVSHAVTRDDLTGGVNNAASWHHHLPTLVIFGGMIVGLVVLPLLTIASEILRTWHECWAGNSWLSMVLQLY